MKASRSSRPARPATRTAAASRAEPARTAEVVLDVEVESGRVHLVLANCGDAVATGIDVTFSRALAGPDDDAPPVSALPLFTRLGVLRPGQALRVFWHSAPALLARADATEPFDATVSWNERGRRRQRATYRHDLSIYRRWPRCVAPGG